MKSAFLKGMGGLMLSFTLILAGCGNKDPDKIEISADHIQISGEASHLFSVVDGSYTLKKTDKHAVALTIKLQAEAPFDQEEFKTEKGDVADTSSFSLSLPLQILDEDGGPASGDAFDKLSLNTDGKQKITDLLAGKTKTVTVTFEAGAFSKKGMSAVMRNAVTFEILNSTVAYTKVKASSQSPGKQIASDLKNTASEVGGAFSSLFGSSDGGSDTSGGSGSAQTQTPAAAETPPQKVEQSPGDSADSTPDIEGMFASLFGGSAKQDSQPQSPLDPKKIEEAARKDSNALIVQAGVGLTEIPEHFLENAYKGKKFTSVIIPEGVTKIGNRAFSNGLIGRGSIERVVLPSTLVEIEPFAFEAQNIKELVIPDSVKIIAVGAFIRNPITRMKLSKNLQEISGSCFKDCNLTEITIPYSVKKIGYRAFGDNKNLNKVVWEGNRETVEFGDSVFRECGFTALPPLPAKMEIIPSAMFSKNKLSGKVVIPKGIIAIGSDAFYENPISEIVLPASCKTVYMGAFSRRNKNDNTLKSVTIGEGVGADGEAYSGTAAIVVTGLLLGPAGLALGAVLNAGKDTEGKSHFTNGFLSIYQDMYQARAGTYSLQNGSWTWTK